MLCLAGKTLPAPAGTEWGAACPSLERSAPGRPARPARPAARRPAPHRSPLEVPAQDVAQDRAQVLGQLGDERVGAGLRGGQPADRRALERDGRDGPLGQRQRVLGLGAQRGQRGRRSRPLAGPSGSSSARSASRWSVSASNGRDALAAHLEAGQRPRQLAGRRRAPARSGCGRPAARPRARRR